MDAVRVSALRESLAGTGWLESTKTFASALRRSVTRRTAAGLLLVGTERYEPWHLAAHLDDEAAWSGVPRLAPTLLRHQVPPDAPAHLSYGLGLLAGARRGATVLVVAPAAAGAGLLERVQDARCGGATVLALDTGDRELAGLAHERLAVPEAEEEPFDLVQHLVSAAAGAAPATRSRLVRLAERLTASPVARW
ncbi:hypothetical protein GCM10010193_64750 [Kitasatospora atroaurantiaca]|uniref:Uncharacterized protein n=1 Tax=Kitasatospora atroaurantiaca TaxID=285545 RepID=A0A561EMH7_9ACTN|nr:hypothetical protein [Kitasatospora atroaurantiaca]TWE16772.1 hypothetical protein FB465_1763 [Kitasatospora atroaurantiaca]